MSAHYLIRLVEEQGVVVTELQDSTGLIDDIVVPHSEKCRGLARYIDPYGRTSFNGLQCEALLVELEAIQQGVAASAQRALLEQLENLLQRAATEVHLHLVFLGD